MNSSSEIEIVNLGKYCMSRFDSVARYCTSINYVDGLSICLVGRVFGLGS